jgi:NADPH:quinone reductase-like Zn-dependent oxidoreductase
MIGAEVSTERWFAEKKITNRSKIYATVGNEEKVQHLMQNFGIPRNRIFNSRNDSFLPEILRETGGKGIDVVLNSLSGKLLHASWKCVAKCGKMLELGKRDFLGHGMLSMDLFQGNRAFFGVDIGELEQEAPEKDKEYVLQYFFLLTRNRVG